MLDFSRKHTMHYYLVVTNAYAYSIQIDHVRGIYIRT